MSTMMEKGRSLGTTAWIGLLILSMLVLAGNTGVATYRSSQLAGANASAASLQVQSQQLAVQGREAVSGKPEAFAAFKKTRDDIEGNVVKLRANYGDKAGVSTPIEKVVTTRAPLGKNADQVIGAEKPVVEFADHADKFTARVPQLQAQLDEVVRAIRAGGATASLAGDALKRDTDVFESVLKGLRDGGNANVQKLTNGSAIAALNQASVLWTDMRKDLDAILGGSNNLFSAQSAAASITGGSDALLEDSQALFDALTAFGSVKSTNPIGHPLVSLVAGALAVLSIVGLLFSLWRAQQKRFDTTKELNDRNQEAIMRLLDEMGSLAEGDLTVKATVTEDMTGAIADSINFAVEQLRSLVATINDTSVQVASSAQETQATAMHLAEAAEHQAQEINSASDKITEIAASINQVSRNSAESADVAQRSVQIATKGAGVVRQTIAGMDSIRDQIQETSKRIKRLGESSQEIGSIVELINDISEQTNILALNAAIQAASAGEAGRGFAVVADEVQRLAERASNATKRIETLVQTIQSDTNEAVSSMEQTTSEVVAGARLAEDAGTALGEIEKVSSDLSNLIQGISSAAQQQSSAASNITQTMHTIQQITSQTSQGANQTAESIGNLAQLAADLRRSVADFKLPA